MNKNSNGCKLDKRSTASDQFKFCDRVEFKLVKIFDEKKWRINSDSCERINILLA